MRTKPDYVWGIVKLSKEARARAVEDADQVELQAIKDGVAANQICARDDEMSDRLMEDHPPIPPTPGHEQVDYDLEITDRIAAPETSKDQLIANATDELRRRASLLGDAYPFRLQEASLEYLGSSTLVYEFCLAVSSSPSVSQGVYKVLPRAFERLVGTLVKLWLGRDANYYRTGWPPDDDRPTTLREMIKELGRRLDGEWVWSPRDKDYERVTGGDAGLDLVVWRSPWDCRNGRIVMMGQCACGEWSGKVSDVRFDKLTKNYCRLPQAGVMKFLAITGHIGHEKEWKDTLTDAGLVFDRIRLTQIAELEENRAVVIAEARQPYEELIRIVVPEFRRLPLSSS